MTITVDLDIEGIKNRVENRIGVVQQFLDERVAADSNYFCPEDTTDLQASVFPIQGNGELEWNITYAKKQYYEGKNKSKDRNPNASLEWFEKAKAIHKSDWQELVNEKYT
jgi:hypothetical protein